jgi:hypothetical protein
LRVETHEMKFLSSRAKIDQFDRLSANLLLTLA